MICIHMQSQDPWASNPAMCDSVLHWPLFVKQKLTPTNSGCEPSWSQDTHMCALPFSQSPGSRLNAEVHALLCWLLLYRLFVWLSLELRHLR